MGIHDTGILILNENVRLNLMKNHTCLNLLKGGIREKFPLTCEKNSMVNPDSFTLDLMVYKFKFALNGTN